MSTISSSFPPLPAAPAPRQRTMASPGNVPVSRCHDKNGAPHHARPRTHLRGQSGQALAEFAIVVPLLLLLVLGVVDFGRAWHAYQVITDAAREGARLAVVARTPPATPADVEAAVRDALSRRNLPSGSGTTSIAVGLVQPLPPATPLVWPGTKGDPAQVRIEQEFTFLFMGPFLRWAAGRETITLSTTSVMRKEW